MRTIIARFLLISSAIFVATGCAFESGGNDGGQKPDGKTDGSGDQDTQYPPGPYGAEYLDTVENFIVDECICTGSTAVGRGMKMERFLGAKAVLVTVHAGWCTYCKQQAATMEDGLWQKYKDQGLQMLLISFQDEQGSSDRQKLLDYCCKNKADFHMTFTQSIDPNAAVTDQFFRPTEAGTPLNMLLDRRMRIRYKVEGVIPQSYILEGNIEGLLSED